tara:strand:+ start:2252 stop:3502 length:1251 start_codon:yes stop_codon:yes gene_type:complete
MAKNIDSQFLNSYSGDFADKIIANLDNADSTVSGKAILTLTPSKQVNFFILMLLYGQWQDEMKKLESPYFNFKHEEVRKALTNYMNVLSQHIEVAPVDLKPLVEDSVVLTLSWLIYPGETLREEVNERGIKHISGIKGLSKYFKIYQDDLSYLISERSEADVQEFLDEWDQLMDQKSIDSILDRELEVLSQVLDITIGDLIPEPESSQEDEMIAFEADVEVRESMEEVEDEADSYGELDTVDEPSEIEDTIDEIEEPTDQVEEVDEISAEEDQPTESNDELDSEQKPVANLIEDEAIEEHVEPDDSLNQKFAQGHETLHDQYKKSEEEVSVAAKHQQKKISSILEAVSLNQEYMFTTELFGGEKDLFLEAVDKIESCDSFDESVEMLVSNYSKEYTWDMNSVEVKELLKVVFRRFR